MLTILTLGIEEGVFQALWTYMPITTSLVVTITVAVVTSVRLVKYFNRIENTVLNTAKEVIAINKRLETFEVSVKADLKDLDRRWDDRHEKFEQKVDDKLQKFEQKMDDKFEKFEQKIDDKLEKFELKIDDKLEKFEKKIDDKLEKFEKKIDDKLEKFEQKVEMKLEKLEQKFEKLDTKIDHKFDTIIEILLARKDESQQSPIRKTQ